MGGLKNKLNSNRGSSILIALGLLLICAMISSVIIVAAASGSSRNVQRQEQQRYYLSMSSASQIIMDELLNIQEKKYIGREELVICGCDKYREKEKKQFPEYENIWGYEIPLTEFNIEGAIEPMFTEICPSGTWKKVTYKSDVNNLDNVLLDLYPTDSQKANMEFLVLEAAEAIYMNDMNGLTDDYEKNFTINVPDTENRLSDVKGKFTMDAGYNIVIELTMDNSAYSVTIKMDANPDYPGEDEVSERDGEDRGHNGWYKIKQSDESMKPNKGEIKFATIIQYKTTTITWNKPMLMKGGAIS